MAHPTKRKSTSGGTRSAKRQRPAPPPATPALSDFSTSPSSASPYPTFFMSPSPLTFPAPSPQVHSSDFNFFPTAAPTPSAVDMNFVGLDPINTGLLMGSLGDFGFHANSAPLAAPLSAPSPFTFGSPREAPPPPTAGPDPFDEWFRASTPASDAPPPPVHLNLPPAAPSSPLPPSSPIVNILSSPPSTPLRLPGGEAGPDRDEDYDDIPSDDEGQPTVTMLDSNVKISKAKAAHLKRLVKAAAPNKQSERKRWSIRSLRAMQSLELLNAACRSYLVVFMARPASVASKHGLTKCYVSPLLNTAFAAQGRSIQDILSQVQDVAIAHAQGGVGISGATARELHALQQKIKEQAAELQVLRAQGGGSSPLYSPVPTPMP